MSVWHEGIYGNDDAQDFLGILAQIYEESEDLDSFLTLAREHPFNRFAECRFVLADLEADLVGDVDYYDDVLSQIEAELTSIALSRWSNPSRREEVLKGFRTSLEQRVSVYRPDDGLPFEEVLNWMMAKQQAPVFESVA